MEKTALLIQKSCLEYLDSRVALLDVKRGDYLVAKGLPLTYWVVVLDGLLVAEDTTSIVAPRPVSLWPECSVILPTSYPGLPRFSIYAATDSRIAVLHRHHFDEAFLSWSDFAFSMFQVSLCNSANAQVMHSRTTCLPTHLKIANLLWGLVPVHKLDEAGGKALRLKLSQQLLGDYFGVTREEINKKFKVLITEGLVEKKDYGFYLTRDVRQALVEQGGTTEPSVPNCAIAAHLASNTPAVPEQFHPMRHALDRASPLLPR